MDRKYENALNEYVATYGVMPDGSAPVKKYDENTKQEFYDYQDAKQVVLPDVPPL